MHEERIDVGGIPGRLYQPPGASAVLLLGHGGGYSKDAPRFEYLSRRYADETGLAVACIDAVDHGERRPAEPFGTIPSGWHSRSVDRMVADWQATASALETIGPTVAYVGFSMGSIFGIPTVAAMPTIRTAVFVVGGIPSGSDIDDPRLGPLILDAASALDGRGVLMLNKSDDEFFAVDDVRATFDAIPENTRCVHHAESCECSGTHKEAPAALHA